MATAEQILSDFKGDHISVRQLGVIMDGSTDSTVNFQAAMNAVVARKIALMIPSDTPLLITQAKFPSELILWGQPGARIMQKDGSAVNNAPFITNQDQMGGNSNIQIQGVQFDFNSANQPGKTGVDGIDLRNVSSIKFTNCRFLNAVQNCLFGFGLTDIDVLDSYFNGWLGDNLGAAIQFQAGNGTTGASSQSLRIRGNTVDGRSSKGTCINLLSDDVRTITGFDISNNIVYPGNAIAFDMSDNVIGFDTLAIQVFCFTKNGFFNGTISNNVIQGSLTSARNRSFGVSVSSPGLEAGPVSITGNAIKDCIGPGIELSSNCTCTSNTLDGSAGISANAYFRADTSGIVIANNILRNTALNLFFPSLLGRIAIALQAGNADSAGPYRLSDVVVTDNLITNEFANSNGVHIQCQQNATIDNLQILGNKIVGLNTADGFGITIGIDPATTGLIRYTNIENNYIENFQGGIIQGGTFGRYIFNRFVNVTTPYWTTFDATDTVLDSDNELFTTQALLVRGSPIQTLPANGDIVIPNETNAVLTGQTAPTSASVLAINGVGFNELQGGYISSNSRWIGGGNWLQNPFSTYAKALFAGFGSKRFSINFGPATNAEGGSPGVLQFGVQDSTWMFSLNPVGIGALPGAGLMLDVTGDSRLRGQLEIDGNITNDVLTSTRPVKTDGSKRFVSGLIDLTSPNDVSASGIAVGDVLIWNSGGGIVGLAGVVTQTLYSVDPGTVTTGPIDYLDHAGNPQTLTFVVSIAPSAHNVTRGVVTN